MTLYEFCATYWPRLLSGTWVTILLFMCSTSLSIVLAIIAGLCKLSASRIIRIIASCYIELFRGTSLLVQLYWIFFVLPLFGLTIGNFEAGVLAVGLNLGAYGAELVRGAITSVPKGQWEAATALNMAPLQRLRRIVVPQAMIISLPMWGNLLIELLKATALVSLIAVADVMFQAKQINGLTFLSTQSFGVALLIYYVLARCVLTPGMHTLEKRLQAKIGRG